MRAWRFRRRPRAKRRRWWCWRPRARRRWAWGRARGRMARQAKQALERARIVCDGQNLARTIASRPGNEINPPSLAKVAQGIAREVGLSCRVLDEKELKRLGMGGLLAVGSGSPNPPRLIALE